MTSATQSVDEAAIAFYVNVYLALNRMKRFNIAYTFVFMVTWSLIVQGHPDPKACAAKLAISA